MADRDTAPSDSGTAAADLVTQARQHALGDLIRRTALRYPDKTAVVFRDERLTFAEFDATVNRTANALAARDVTKGDRIAVLSHNCAPFVVLSFALAKLGAVLVPVNFMLGADEIAFILEHSGATGMVTEDALGDVADKALESAGVAGAVRGWIPLTGSAPAAGWEDVATWAA